MKIGKWFAQRGPEFIRRRATSLLTRYGITSAKAKNRVEACMASLGLNGCKPTFPVPGTIVRRNASFIRHLQDAGAEIAVHSYDHIDLKALPPTEAGEQLVKAAKTFALYGIEAYGFRCPYLSCTDELVDLLPKGLFGYSSNAAIRWDAIPSIKNHCSQTVFKTIEKFYRPGDSKDSVCVPWRRDGMVEIPVCVPDDLQLHDGLGLTPENMAEVWCQILQLIHERGELFTIIFHPELAEYCEQPFLDVLQQARRLQPSVWIARMRDISDWWREKSKFRSDVSITSKRLRISLICSERATILARGLSIFGRAEAWDGPYFRLNTVTLEVPDKPRPFVGIASNASMQVVSFLREQGYILDMSETASQCAIYLDGTTLSKLRTHVELINKIEKTAGPLIRYWRWPNGAKSALSITGDLDALSLLDYASRPFVP